MAANTLQTSRPIADRLALKPVTGSAGLRGFGNLFRKELSDWFGTWRWLIQGLIWVALLDGFLAFSLFVVPVMVRSAPRTPGQPVPPLPDALSLGLQTFFPLAGLAGAIGVIILAQDAIIGEKQSGTAAWILSKPVSRVAFLLAKLIADAIGIGIFILALPGVIAYALIWLAVGQPLGLLPFAAGLGLIGLLFFFYLALTLVLGVLFSGRGPVLGITLGLAVGGGLVGSLISQVEQVIPDMLPKAGSMLAAGQALPAVAVWPLVSTAVWSLVFLGLAFWRFSRQEI